MIATGTALGCILALWAALTIFGKWRDRLSWRQAALYAPLRLVYRIDARALRPLRSETRVIYVVSHESRLDPALMLSLLPDDTLHILDRHSAATPWLEPYREMARTIAFNAAHLYLSRRLVRVLRGGGRLCVYLPPEIEPDQRTFQLYRAVARVAVKAEAKVITLQVAGARNLHSSLTPADVAPRRLLPRLTVHALPAQTIAQLAARSPAEPARPSSALFDRVAEVRMKAGRYEGDLFGALRQAAARFGTADPAVQDSLGTAMSYRRLLIATRILAERFAARGARGDVLGLLLPNAAPVATAFFAAQSAGMVAAMLNYTAGPANIAAAVRTGRIRNVVTSRTFVEKAQLGDEIAAIEAEGARLVWLEDLRADVGRLEMLAGALFHRFRAVPAPKANDAAVMLFTSGSEGLPKGVLLSHANILSNVAQVSARIAFSPRDTLFNVLPVFHSFGLTGGMVLPLLGGVRLHLYPSPLHYKAIPEAVAKVAPTILFGTDTFLAAYSRTAADSDFASVRLVVAGAEAVRTETRRVWRERFGAEIMEGYGMTEASPVVAVNSATHSRAGTVGRLLPGIAARLEQVEGIAEGGRLLISGPNVMLGYATDDPQKHAAPPDGWHDSGDIVSIDREGFVTIRGRARRFAKIAGEMVSLGAVEMLAHDLWPEAKHAAVSVPDPRKGERIVLVSTQTDATREAYRKALRKAGGSELMAPAEIVSVEDMPVLGTGKTDYAAVQRLARASLGLADAA